MKNKAINYWFIVSLFCGFLVFAFRFLPKSFFESPLTFFIWILIVLMGLTSALVGFYFFFRDRISFKKSSDKTLRGGKIDSL